MGEIDRLTKRIVVLEKKRETAREEIIDLRHVRRTLYELLCETRTALRKARKLNEAN